ncbi:hypothetical protein K501DRAFT_312350 [Backusella circina FSU 941]|nr:hypothetical protein K501DRAFT_312350 [Backusella circina FSU 941]
MPYTNWENAQDIVMRLKLCKVKNVVDNLQVLRGLITKRRVDKSSVNLIETFVYTCEKDSRLPASEHFVIDGDGDWSLYLDKLRMSVYMILRTVNGQNGCKYKELEELEEQALEYIHKILNLLYNPDVVFTQSILEKKYSLIWIDADDKKNNEKNNEKNAEAPKRAWKNSTKFRKSIHGCITDEEMRKVILDEVSERLKEE